MSDINPYQSPKYYDMDAPEPAEAAEPIEVRGIWRQGDLLVVREDALLPDRCVMSNEPAQGRRITKVFHWFPPAVYLAGFVCVSVGGLAPGLLIEFGWLAIVPGLLVWHFLSVILSGSVVIDMPISPKRHARQRRMLVASQVFMIAAIGMILIGLVLPALHRPPPRWIRALDGFAVLLPPGVFLIGAVVRSFATRLPAVRRIKADYVWLKGVHPDYLADLPEWPGA